MQDTANTIDTTPSRPTDSPMPVETANTIRRYMQIQREMAQLEREKEQIRNALVMELGDEVPTTWRPVLDGRPLVIVHTHRTTVRYDEETLRARLGDRYPEILELDGTKIRKNRDLVRPYLSAVLDQVGTPSAARVEAAIRSGAVSPDAFHGAYQKSVTPFISIRIDGETSSRQ